MKSIKLNLLSLIAIAGIAFTSCSSDDSVANRAPNTFDLIELADGATNVDVQPKLSWEAATDPDGDKLTYEVFVDTQNPPTTSLTKNLGINMFNLSENLEPETKYYWMVVATDIEGNATQSNIASFTTRDMTIAEAIVGKWFYESAEGKKAFTACEKKTFVLFTKDLFIQIKEFGEEDNICTEFGSGAATYKFISHNQVQMSSGGNIEIWEVEAISKTTLILKINTVLITFIKE